MLNKLLSWIAHNDVMILTWSSISAVYLSFGPIGQNVTVSVTEACARRLGATASVSLRRRERRTLLAGGGRRASRSHTLAASQAFSRMHMLLPEGKNLGTPRYIQVAHQACILYADFSEPHESSMTLSCTHVCRAACSTQSPTVSPVSNEPSCNTQHTQGKHIQTAYIR